MSSRYAVIYCALLLCLSLFISACRTKDAPENQSDQEIDAREAVVLVTDSDEWHVATFAVSVTYAEAIQVTLQSPYILPTRSDAAVMHTLEYPSEERFVTSDGYTFAMPSASVTKAGKKTKYSVIGLHRRRIITYDIPF